MQLAKASVMCVRLVSTALSSLRLLLFAWEGFTAPQGKHSALNVKLVTIASLAHRTQRSATQGPTATSKQVSVQFARRGTSVLHAVPRHNSARQDFTVKRGNRLASSVLLDTSV